MRHVLALAVTAVVWTTSLSGCVTAGGSTTATPATAQAQSPAPTAATFRATGNEPGWRLDIGATELTLLTNFGQTRFIAPTPAAQVTGATTKYVARSDQGELTATIVDRLCVDTMSGMPHPQSVTIVVDGKTLAGCGGEPASLLQGAEWSVVAIGGAALVAGSQATLNFAPDGRLSGHASCNRFTSKYTLSGEGLAISQPAGTRMMCDAARMEQERVFLAALAATQSFSIAADGTLLLQASDGRTLKARRH